jgi:hypothetical protein
MTAQPETIHHLGMPVPFAAERAEVQDGIGCSRFVLVVA